jgi:hypothetical protein
VRRTPFFVGKPLPLPHPDAPLSRSEMFSTLRKAGISECLEKKFRLTGEGTDLIRKVIPSTSAEKSLTSGKSTLTSKKPYLTSGGFPLTS